MKLRRLIAVAILSLAGCGPTSSIPRKASRPTITECTQSQRVGLPLEECKPRRQRTVPAPRPSAASAQQPPTHADREHVTQRQAP